MEQEFKFDHHLQLTEMGVENTDIRFAKVSMTSHRVVIRGDSSINIIDLSKKKLVTAPIAKVQSAIMHPTNNIVALRGKTTLHLVSVFSGRGLTGIQYGYEDEDLRNEFGRQCGSLAMA